MRAADTVRRLALVALGAGLLPAVGCGKEDVRYLLEKKPIAELPYQGYRRDIPAERRGNGTFVKGAFTRDDRYLVTLGPGISVWDPHTGALRRTLPASLQGDEWLVADGAHHVVLGRRNDVAPSDSESLGLWIWNLDDGTRAGPIPEASDTRRARPVGVTANGEVVVVRDGRIETWGLDGRGPRVTLEPPAGHAFCAPGDPIYHDAGCASLSPSGRWLAIAVMDTTRANVGPDSWLVDVAAGTWRAVTLPPTVDLRSQRSYAFSPDERTLAIEVADGMWINHPVAAAPVTGEPGGQLVRGEHQRNHFLKPVAFAANGGRLVALGDQVTVATYNAATGALVGRTAPPFSDLEGVLHVSADGSRAVAYRFIADILVVIDGATGAPRGYVCPFFCNRAHNPVAVPYAVSPDGQRVATGGRLGAGLWSTDADTLIAPLMDPKRPALTQP